MGGAGREGGAVELVPIDPIKLLELGGGGNDRWGSGIFFGGRSGVTLCGTSGITFCGTSEGPPCVSGVENGS